MKARTHTITVIIKPIETVTDISYVDTCTNCYERKTKYLAVPDKFYCEYELCEECYQKEFLN